MSERETEERTEQQDEVQGQATTWYAPNQQAVRADESGPAEEGTGGDPGAGTMEMPETQAPAEAAAADLDAMTKEELLSHARSLGVSPANATMTKDELRDAIDAHTEGAG